MLALLVSAPWLGGVLGAVMMAVVVAGLKWGSDLDKKYPALAPKPWESK